MDYFCCLPAWRRLRHRYAGNDNDNANGKNNNKSAAAPATGAAAAATAPSAAANPRGGLGTPQRPSLGAGEAAPGSRQTGYSIGTPVVDVMGSPTLNLGQVPASPKPTPMRRTPPKFRLSSAVLSVPAGNHTRSSSFAGMNMNSPNHNEGGGGITRAHTIVRPMSSVLTGSPSSTTAMTSSPSRAGTGRRIDEEWKNGGWRNM